MDTGRVSQANSNLIEQTVSSEMIYQGKIISLRRDKVKLPNGAQSYREVVVHRGAIAVVPVLEGSTVVMVRQFRQPAGQVLLEIPAGTLELDEEPVCCAERELQEEIGYKPGKLRLLFSSYLAPGYSSEMLHTFLAEELTISRVENDEDEFIETVNLPLDRAVEMVLAGQIKDAKTICGVLAAERLLRE